MDSVSPRDLPVHLRAASDASPENAADSFDALGLEIARRYNSSLISFADADTLANAMFSAMCHGAFFTDYFDADRVAARVYYAFDEGEYIHRGESDAIDPVEKYTNPMIEEILKEYFHA